MEKISIDADSAKAGGECSLEPLVYVEDRGGFLLVTADLPGVGKGDLEVSIIDESFFEVSAKTQKTYSGHMHGYWERGYRFSSFHKVLTLPCRVDVEASSASFEKGMLEVRMPKKLEKKKIGVR